MRLGIMKAYQIDAETAETYVTQFMDSGGDQKGMMMYDDPYGRYEPGGLRRCSSGMVSVPVP